MIFITDKVVQGPKENKKTKWQVKMLNYDKTKSLNHNSNYITKVPVITKF
jgi:hypothetical protein